MNTLPLKHTKICCYDVLRFMITLFVLTYVGIFFTTTTTPPPTPQSIVQLELRESNELVRQIAAQSLAEIEQDAHDAYHARLSSNEQFGDFFLAHDTCYANTIEKLFSTHQSIDISLTDHVMYARLKTFNGLIGNYIFVSFEGISLDTQAEFSSRCIVQLSLLEPHASSNTVATIVNHDIFTDR
jgi:hypothetical protein